MTDCIERFQFLRTAKNKLSIDLVGKHIRSGSSEKSGNPCDLYKKIVDKREMEREKERARLNKERDEKKLIAYENECIKDQMNCWKEEFKCLPKTDEDNMKCFNESVVHGIKKTCKCAAKRRLIMDLKKKQKIADSMEKENIKKILLKCEEKERLKSNQKPCGTCKGQLSKSKKSKTPEYSEENLKGSKNAYLLKVDTCVDNQWAKYCMLMEKFSKCEQVRLGRAHKCMAAEFLASCKRKTLKEICAKNKYPDRTKKDKPKYKKKEGKRKRSQLDRELEMAEREEKAYLQNEIKTVKLKCLEKLYMRKFKCKQLREAVCKNKCDSSKLENGIDCNDDSTDDKKRKDTYLRKWLDYQKTQKNEALKQMCKITDHRKKCKDEALKNLLCNSTKKDPCVQEEDPNTCVEKVLKKQYVEQKKKSSVQCKNVCVNKKPEVNNYDEITNKFRANMFKTLKTQCFQSGNKISIIGGGSVGVGCAMALTSKGLTNDLVLYDVNNDLCNSEQTDLMCGTSFLNTCKIHKADNVDSTKDSRVVVVTTEATDNENGTETGKIIKDVMPKLAEKSPKAVFLIAANPIDVMTWLAGKITNLPRERCFGTGCHLDTARFRMLIANTLGVSSQAVNGYILGEQGDGSVPIWSTVTVGGTTLHDILPEIGTDKDPMYWANVHKEVIVASERVKEGVGCTNWAIGLTVADVISAIFEDSYRIMSLSTNANGICGICHDVYLSLPCIVNKWGLYAVVHPQVSICERILLRKSAATLLEAQCGMGKIL